MADINLSCYRGDTAKWELTVRDANNALVDLTSGSIIMAARRNEASPVLFELSSIANGGITIADQGTNPGVATIRLRPDDTLQLPNDVRTIFYTVHAFVGGDEWCVASGHLTVNPVAPELIDPNVIINADVPDVPIRVSGIPQPGQVPVAVDAEHAIWSYGTGFAVENLTELAAESISTRSDGFLVYVKTLRSYFALERSSTLAPDGITVVAGHGLAGSAWVRTPIAHSSWLTRSEFFIDTVGGNDENDGSSATQDATHVGPLKTAREIARRLGPRARINPPSTSFGENRSRILLISVVGDMQAGDVLSLDLVLGDSTSVWVRGSSVPVAAGTLTAARAMDPGDTVGGTWNARNVAQGVTDSAATWAPLQRLRITSSNGGADRSDCFCWVTYVEPGNIARTSTMGDSRGLSEDLIDDTPFEEANQLGNPVTPRVGDGYAIERPSRIILGDMRVAFEGCSDLDLHWLPAIFFTNCSFRSSSVLPTGNLPQVPARLRFGAPSPASELDSGGTSTGSSHTRFSVVAYGCLFEEHVNFDGSSKLVNCALSGGGTLRSGVTWFDGGWTVAALGGNYVLSLPGARALFSGDFLSESCSVMGTGLMIESLALFNFGQGSDYALVVGGFMAPAMAAGGSPRGAMPGGGAMVCALLNNGAARLWGKSMDTPRQPVCVAKGCTLVYSADAAFFVKGGDETKDFVLGVSALARSVDDATGTETIDNATWPNLNSAASLNGQAEWAGAAIRLAP